MKKSPAVLPSDLWTTGTPETPPFSPLGGPSGPAQATRWLPRPPSQTTAGLVRSFGTAACLRSGSPFPSARQFPRGCPWSMRSTSLCLQPRLTCRSLCSAWGAPPPPRLQNPELQPPRSVCTKNDKANVKCLRVRNLGEVLREIFCLRGIFATFLSV